MAEIAHPDEGLPEASSSSATSDEKEAYGRWYDNAKRRLDNILNAPPEDNTSVLADSNDQKLLGQSDSEVRRREESAREHFERVRSLRFEEFILPRDLPPAQALRELELLYNKNLVPDHAFEHLALGEQGEFLAVSHHGMLNRFQPSDEELSRYPQNHESVRVQMFRDLWGESDRPGDFRVFVLRDTKGVVRAWGSFRLPSKEPSRMQSYKKYIDRLLYNDDSAVVLENGMRDVLKKAKYQLGEVDTLNVEEGWNYGGTLLLHHALRTFRAERGEEGMPKGFFFFRCDSLRPIEPKPEDSEEDITVDLGENPASARWKRSIGAGDIGYRQRKNDYVVRIIGNQTYKVGVKWRYSSAKTKVLERRAGDRLLEKGLLSDE